MRSPRIKVMERIEFEKIVDSIIRRCGEKIVAIAPFGSVARGEATEISDIDLFIVVKDFPKSLERRRKLYDAAYRELPKGGDVTVIDIDEEELFTQDLEVTPLLLNIAWDAEILHEPGGKLTELLTNIRGAIERAGLERYRTPDGKYGWKPRSPNP